MKLRSRKFCEKESLHRIGLWRPGLQCMDTMTGLNAALDEIQYHDPVTN